jgi:tripartite-type tricarboxylate transporter receptor subunit TctC
MTGQVSRTAALFLALLAAMVLSPVAACAQQFPSGSIKILVGFGPGSTADILARLVGKHYEQVFGQPVVVENRPGNSSMIAAEIVARAPKDGGTLFVASVANTLNPAFTHSKFNLSNELAGITALGLVPNLLVVHPSVPANNIKELVALARANPDSLTFGTSGAGTASHLAAELFNQHAGTKIVAVHYQAGSNQVLTDLLTGRISMAFNVAVTLTPHVRRGALRAIAVAQPKRARILPDVPTLAEEGMPGVDAGIWFGLMAPAGTPPDILDKLSVAANAALKTPPAVKVLDAAGIDPLGDTSAEFDTFIKADIAKWTKVIEASGLRK